MPRYGFSLVAVLVLAAPSWASYLPSAGADGYPTEGYAAPARYATETPAGWYGHPTNAPAGADPNGFAFDPCNACAPPALDRVTRCGHEYWVRGDWLLWNFRNTPVPALITTGNPALPNPAVPGGGNFTPLGAGPIDLGAFNGARVTLGQWFDPDGELGAELSGFAFGREGSAAFFAGSAATPVLSVPVIGTNGAPTVFDFAFPGRFVGALGVRTASQLWGAEGTLLHRWHGDGCLSIDGLFGYRFLQLNERVELFGRSQATGALGTFGGAILPAGVTVFTRDAFRGRTEFHGAQVGGRAEWRRDMFTLTAFGKGGAGINVQTLRVEGNTTATGAGATRTLAGGVRGLRSNIGRETNTDFSLIGETGVELGFQVTKSMSLRVGYNLLFWSDVLRPGNVIDPVVSFNQVPIDPTFRANAVAARPATVFRSSDFLAHGLVVGVLFDY